MTIHQDETGVGFNGSRNAEPNSGAVDISSAYFHIYDTIFNLNICEEIQLPSNQKKTLQAK